MAFRIENLSPTDNPRAEYIISESYKSANNVINKWKDDRVDRKKIKNKIKAAVLGFYPIDDKFYDRYLKPYVRTRLLLRDRALQARPVNRSDEIIKDRKKKTDELAKEIIMQILNVVNEEKKRKRVSHGMEQARGEEKGRVVLNKLANVEADPVIFIETTDTRKGVMKAIRDEFKKRMNEKLFTRNPMIGNENLEKEEEELWNNVINEKDVNRVFGNMATGVVVQRGGKRRRTMRKRRRHSTTTRRHKKHRRRATRSNKRHKKHTKKHRKKHRKRRVTRRR
jgi:hypothetical protein